MSNSHAFETSLDDTILDIVKGTPWPLLLISADGQILSLSRAIRDLLSADESALVGRHVGLIVHEADRPQLTTALAQNITDSALIRVHLNTAEPKALEAELQASVIDGDSLRRMTLNVYLGSLAQCREQFMLELNRVLPRLLTAQSADELFATATQALKKVYLRMAVLLEDTARGQLFVYYIKAPAGREMGYDIAGSAYGESTPVASPTEVLPHMTTRPSSFQVVGLLRSSWRIRGWRCYCRS